jgi:hypothetical protein
MLLRLSCFFFTEIKIFKDSKIYAILIFITYIYPIGSKLFNFWESRASRRLRSFFLALPFAFLEFNLFLCGWNKLTIDVVRLEDFRGEKI